MSYIDELASELAAVGIRGRLRLRIISEIRDHLECDPEADLGSPTALAAQFADEVGTERTRRAAWAGFGALAVAGTLFGAAFIAAAAGFPHRPASSAPLGAAGAWLAALGAQVAFAAGSLAVIRILRRPERVLPRAEATVLARRTAIGLGAGFLAMTGVALIVIEYGHGVARASSTLALAAAAVGALALLAATPAVSAAARVRPTAAGPAGDVFADLGGFAPRWLRGHPWWLAVAVACGIVVALTLAGVAQDDGYDGAARGIADALAFMACFWGLGGYLGLRQPGHAARAS